MLLLLLGITGQFLENIVIHRHLVSLSLNLLLSHARELLHLFVDLRLLNLCQLDHTLLVPRDALLLTLFLLVVLVVGRESESFLVLE